MVVALNLGGEGEPVTGADFVIHLNLFRDEVMVRPRFASRLATNHVATAASAAVLPLRPASIDLIVAHHFPIQFDRTLDDFPIRQLADEAFRVARPGSRFDLACSSCDLDALANAMMASGFADVTTDRRQYAVRGRKP